MRQPAAGAGIGWRKYRRNHYNITLRGRGSAKYSDHVNAGGFVPCDERSAHGQRDGRRAVQ